jgi:hypothetical protein
MASEVWTSENFWYYLLYRFSGRTQDDSKSTIGIQVATALGGTFIYNKNTVTQNSQMPSTDPAPLAFYLYSSQTSEQYFVRLVQTTENRQYKTYDLRNGNAPGAFAVSDFSFKDPPGDAGAFVASPYGSYMLALCSGKALNANAYCTGVLATAVDVDRRVSDFCTRKTTEGAKVPIGLTSDQCSCYQGAQLDATVEDWFQYFQDTGLSVDPWCTVANCTAGAYVPGDVRSTAECPSHCYNKLTVSSPPDARNRLELRNIQMNMNCDVGDVVVVGAAQPQKTFTDNKCPKGCAGNGTCNISTCLCNPGFGGDDCATNLYAHQPPTSRSSGGPGPIVYLIAGAFLVGLLFLIYVLYRRNFRKLKK